jgi:hypothetical protein
MPDYARLCPVVSLATGKKPDKYSPVRHRPESPVRAIALAQWRWFWRDIPLARNGNSSISESPAVRALIVLTLTLLVLIVSAILLPPKDSQATPGERSGNAAANSPH